MISICQNHINIIIAKIKIKILSLYHLTIKLYNYIN